MAEITFADGCYKVKFDYNKTLVDKLKNSIPNMGRNYKGEDRSWIIDAKYEKTLAILFPGDAVPAPIAFVAAQGRYMIDLRYLGQVKDRGNGDHSSLGFTKGAWSVCFSESVLKEWFLGTVERPKLDTSSLYGILNIPNFSGVDEIKTGYRRMAKQWHPDYCHEPDATRIFQQIREAYDILGSEKKIRYDVGLGFELGLEKPKTALLDNGFYRTPLRCGNVEVEGVNILGRLIVSKIYSWTDIVDVRGRTLVTSWSMDDKVPFESWVQS